MRVNGKKYGMSRRVEIEGDVRIDGGLGGV